MAAEKMREDRLQPIWFAAGTAALMACIERAVVVSLFAHWRIWAFLALNLLLLAILFTSKSQTSSNEKNPEDDDSTELDRMKIRQNHGDEPKIETKEKRAKEERDQSYSANEGNDSLKFELRNGEDDGKLESQDEISKEELNQRVEAFIAMFRQHLVYDAKGKSFGQVNSTRRASFSYSNEFVRTRRKA